MKAIRGELLICGGSACETFGAKKVKDALEREIQRVGLKDEFRIVVTGCFGFCAQGPLVLVKPENVLYQQVSPDDIPELVEEHLLKGRPLKRLLYKEPQSKELIPFLDHIPFFSKQAVRVLRNRGIIDPEKIEEYIARDGYMAAHKALVEMGQDEIIEEIKISGLRGRGGASFPTGLKWELVKTAKGDEKFVVCNGDEGDPGSYMDRALMEGDPHAILEGMIIAGKAVGANKGYIYTRAEYKLAIRRLNIAISQAREYGLLGEDIFGSGFDFDIQVFPGAGAYICGEETAMMATLEGKRGMPRPRPPYLYEKGLWGKPTLINNVETFANIPLIILNGSAWFSMMGTENSKGTKVFAVSGAVNDSGLVEVPFGVTIRDIIYERCGGIKGGRALKAVQIGDSSGGSLPPKLLDTPLDYEIISRLGAHIGSGAITVMDERSCMVNMARFFIQFCYEESCGKCTPCREGTKRMLEILEKIIHGKGELKDLEELEALATFIKGSALCGLGQTAPNPTLSMLRYFREEFLEHIIEKRCRAGVCVDLYKAKCINACPLGQDVPGYLSLVAEGRYEEAITLIYQTNPLPGVCGRVCTHPCMDVCMRKQTDEALAIPKIKRFAADMARVKGFKPRLSKRGDGKEVVAIVGGGPAGLAAAFYLALMGYRPHIYEELPKLGGMLRYGIPAYRLPREILDEEIGFIVSLGVEITTGCKVGRDIPFNELRRRYPAIFVGVGAHRSQKMGIPGDGHPKVLGGAEFLRSCELGEIPEIGKKVAVIGGGNVAIDVARTARRMGAEVTILYRRERKDMPAYEEEIEDALEEGVLLKTLVAPKGVMERGGKLILELDQCEPGEFDSSGRRRPIPIEGCVITEEYDTIFAAIGQSPDLSFTSEIRSKRDIIEVDRFSLMTNVPGVFAGGDAVLGPARVVDALAHGKKAAIQIDKYLSDLAGRQPTGITEIPIEVTMKVPEQVIKTPRARMPKISSPERLNGFREVELGYDEGTAREECKRCLRCDVKL